MGGTSMWLRSAARYQFPVMLLVQVMAMLNVQDSPSTRLPGWSVDWSWMLSVWNGGTLLLSPVAAALVVLMVQGTWRAPTDDLIGVMPRAGRSRWDILMAVLVQGWLVQLLTLAVASACCVVVHADTSGLTMPWQLLTGPCALVASVFLGGVVGEYWKDPWAIPVTAVGVFLSQRIFFWKGYPELLSTEMATGPVTGARPIPAHLIATCSSNLALAAGLVCLLLWHVRTRGHRRNWLLVVACAAVATVVVIFLPFVTSHAMDTYEPR